MQSQHPLNIRKDVEESAPLSPAAPTPPLSTTKDTPVFLPVTKELAIDTFGWAQLQNTRGKYGVQDTMVLSGCGALFEFAEWRDRLATLALLGDSLEKLTHKNDNRTFYKISGTTCNGIFIRAQRETLDFMSFNIGDSLAFHVRRIGKQWMAQQLSNEHRIGATLAPGDKLSEGKDPEYKRVCASRLMSGVGRISAEDEALMEVGRLPAIRGTSGLGLSRALGDLSFQTYGLSAAPEIAYYEEVKRSEEDYILVASDGLFEQNTAAYTKPEELLVKFLDQCTEKEINNSARLAQRLCQLAREQSKSLDDCSVAWLKLDPKHTEKPVCHALYVLDGHGPDGKKASEVIAYKLKRCFTMAVVKVRSMSCEQKEDIIARNFIQNQDINQLISSKILRKDSVNSLHYLTKIPHSEKTFRYPLLYLAVACGAQNFAEYLFGLGIDPRNVAERYEGNVYDFAVECDSLVTYFRSSPYISEDIKGLGGEKGANNQGAEPESQSDEDDEICTFNGKPSPLQTHGAFRVVKPGTDGSSRERLDALLRAPVKQS